MTPFLKVNVLIYEYDIFLPKLQALTWQYMHSKCAINLLKLQIYLIILKIRQKPRVRNNEKIMRDLRDVIHMSLWVLFWKLAKTLQDDSRSKTRNIVLTWLFYLSIAQDLRKGYMLHDKGNRSKLKIKINLLWSGGESLFESMCTYKVWKRCSNFWSNSKFVFARD